MIHKLTVVILVMHAVYTASHPSILPAPLLDGSYTGLLPGPEIIDLQPSVIGVGGYGAELIGASDYAAGEFLQPAVADSLVIGGPGYVAGDLLVPGPEIYGAGPAIVEPLPIYNDNAGFIAGGIIKEPLVINDGYGIGEPPCCIY